MIGTGTGISYQYWGSSLLDFFGIYSYGSGEVLVLTGHSFTVVGLPNIPEPATAALIALGLLGPVLAGRAARNQKRTSRASD